MRIPLPDGTKIAVSELPHGLYLINWVDGGTSLASVGSDSDGRRWYAPTNWVTVPGYDWSIVQSAEHLRSW
ncbi:MAG: hypothetical protein AAGE52_01595 [Myxococcota bacterium]